MVSQSINQSINQSIDQSINQSSFTSRLTRNKSFQRRVFTGNHLHWYWQLKTNRRKYTKAQIKR